MNSSLLSAMICISGIVIAAVVVLVITLLRPKSDSQRCSDYFYGNRQIETHKLAALATAVWRRVHPCDLTIWGALFFLVVVWVLRMNPNSDASFTISNNEKKTARRVYNVVVSLAHHHRSDFYCRSIQRILQIYDQ